MEAVAEPKLPTRPGPWSWVPSYLSGFLTFVAVLCAVAAVSEPFRREMRPFRWVIDQFLVPAPANLAYAAFVAILAAAVARRKRVAYRLVAVFFGLQLVADLILLLLLRTGVVQPGDLVDEAVELRRVAPHLTWITAVNLVVTAAIVVVLGLGRREFYARVQRASVLKAVVTLAAGLTAGIAVGYTLVAAYPGRLRGSDRLTYTAEKVLGDTVDLTYDVHASPPGWVRLVLGLLGAAALFAALLALFRSQRAAAVLAPADEARIRALLAAHGERDSLGYFATRRDKAVIFSPTGKAAVTYRVVAGVCLASGDPIGEPEAWGPAIDAWLGQAREYAWTTAVMGASEDGARAYARAGLKVLELGDEAIIDVAGFTLDGRDMRPVRQAVRRIERAGYTARVRRHAEVPDDEMAGALHLADMWRDTAAERGFSMALSRLGDPADGECVLVEALDANGRTVALLSFTPWGRHGLSLDLMRRDRNRDNGLMEFMVAALVDAAPKLGVTRVSLNFAVFRSAFEEGARIGAGPVLRAWRRLLLFFSRWWQLEALYRSNVKYRPQWVPRFICFGERRDLAKVGLATAMAEGFLALPGRRGPTTQPPAAPLPERIAEAEPAAPTVVEEAPPAPAPLVPEQVRIRREKLDRLREGGVDPYPVCFERSHTCGAVVAAHAGLPPDTHTGDRVAVAGRVVRWRDHGRIGFATLGDWTGEIQVMISEPDALRRWSEQVDRGDHVGVVGEVVTSRRGELSVAADRWVLTAKCLQPLPDKHRGLTDPEALVRQRYVDLIVNPGARETLRARGAVTHALRQALHGRGYLEVETPVLQPVHGGANARPFVTHSNAYDLRLYLRIAPELYLKRLCVGGVDRVFELGRVFRNEGVSVKHNPEFTMLEAYQAYADYTTMRDLTRTLVREACVAALGTTVVRRDGTECDLGGEWPVVPVYKAISAALGEEVGPGTPGTRLRELAAGAHVWFDPQWSRGALVLELYERLVEAVTTTPTFYVDFPADVSPLARPHRRDPRLAERWDLVAFGTELGTGYSELIDPVEQRRRLTEQSLRAAAGDPEAMELDEDFLHALEYAMPPTGGLGLGVDRLVMLVTDHTVRESLPFPLVRPA
jgi:lysyl-tRNA synthetase, class II